MIRHRVAVTLLAMIMIGLAPAPLSGQTVTPPHAEKDIVVEGIRDVGPDALAAARSAVPSSLGFRRVASLSSQFARCLGKLDLNQLHAVFDSPPNSRPSFAALDRLVRAHLGCYPALPSPTPAPPFFGECNPTLAEDIDEKKPTYLKTCRAFYDRGELLLLAFDRYLPDAILTTQQTSDPVVQRRFDEREIPRNKLRVPADYRYFTVAVCIVRSQPALAGRLVRAHADRSLQDRIGRLILLRARTCVGNAKTVHVEPSQFTIFIADAYYRWLAAAADAPSPLPAAAPTMKD